MILEGASARGQSIAPREAKLPNPSVSPSSPFSPCCAPQAFCLLMSSAFGVAVGRAFAALFFLFFSSMSRKHFRVLDEGPSKSSCRLQPFSCRVRRLAP